MKVVVNKCFGGFSISKECAEYMASLGDKQAQTELNEWQRKQDWLDEYKRTGRWGSDVPNEEKESLEISAKYNSSAPWFGFGSVDDLHGYSRTSETLIKAVEHLGQRLASGEYSALDIVEIPDDVE